MPTMTSFNALAIAVSISIALVAATPVARADCIADAAARHRVNAEVLRAIGWQESRLQPLALGRNADGSIDVGAFQINSVHLPELARYGIDRFALRDGCVSADVAAWHYRRQIDLQGDTWLAVGAYHSRTPARATGYANRVAAILMRWHVLPPGALPFPVDRARGPLPPATSPGRRHDADVAYDTLAYLPSAR
jgi:soluble lytic murein transglycosylase-like protein